jgi:hypothetical protein
MIVTQDVSGSQISFTPAEVAQARFAQSLLRLRQIGTPGALELWNELRPFLRLFSEVEQ